MTSPEASSSTGGMKPTLGLTGVTVNAMALIAPGAFLWLTFQIQAAQSVGGITTAMDMVPGLLLALLLAFLTAYSYSQLASKYPKAGTGSSYYFAEAALLNREEGQHYRFARLAKFVVGWTSHLYYWVYPGLMIGVFSTLIQYVAGLFGLPFATQTWFAWGIAIVMAIGVGSIAYRGIVGSTATAIGINAIQITALVILGILAIVFRLTHASNAYSYSSIIDVVKPHAFSNVIFQATIAILLLVGFESITSLGAETKDAKRNIPLGIILALVIQGLICYAFEYVAANYFMGSQYKIGTGKSAVTGLNAAAVSSAPIGDMANIIGNWLGGFGFALTIIIAVTVAIAIIGTTLACLNTGVRVTFAMGRDKEIPSFFGLMHGKFAVPHMGIVVLAGISALIGIYSSTAIGPFLAIDTLSQVTYISNIGTFLLYGMTCLIVLFAFRKESREEYHPIKHRLIPLLGFLLNLGMLVGVVYLAITSGNTPTAHTAESVQVAIGAVAVFMVLGGVLLVLRSRQQNVSILHRERPQPLLQTKEVVALQGEGA